MSECPFQSWRRGDGLRLRQLRQPTSAVQDAGQLNLVISVTYSAGGDPLSVTEPHEATLPDSGGLQTTEEASKYCKIPFTGEAWSAVNVEPVRCKEQ
jgi:hypothetical protein